MAFDPEPEQKPWGLGAPIKSMNMSDKMIMVVRVKDGKEVTEMYVLAEMVPFDFLDHIENLPRD